MKAILGREGPFARVSICTLSSRSGSVDGEKGLVSSPWRAEGGGTQEDTLGYHIADPPAVHSLGRVPFLSKPQFLQL